MFKFQQQKDQDISIAEDARTVYDIYKVEIPASLTAHAQVMYVDEFGKRKISLAQENILSVEHAQKRISLKGG